MRASRVAEARTEAAYRPPPAALEAVGDGGRVLLEGVADPDARVRLATPDGQAAFAMADRQGRWRIVLPAPAGVRLYGLSMAGMGANVQAQGYLAVAPGPTVAQLRSGAGAITLGRSEGLRITAIDYDHKGAGVVSGRAQPRGEILVLLDGRLAARGQADAAGAFSLDLDAPLDRGVHRLAAQSGGASTTASLEMSPPAAPARGPFEAQPDGGGWRIVWITPGGGLQTTVLPGRSA